MTKLLTDTSGLTFLVHWSITADNATIGTALIAAMTVSPVAPNLGEKQASTASKYPITEPTTSPGMTAVFCQIASPLLLIISMILVGIGKMTVVVLSIL